MQKTVIDSTTKKFVNSVKLPDNWSGANGEWQIPQGHEFINGMGRHGDTWNGSSFDSPPVNLQLIREGIYKEVNDECDDRCIIASGMSHRGGKKTDLIADIHVSATGRNQQLASTLADLIDKRELLKDTIDAAVDEATLDLIDVTDNAHWI